MTANPVSLSETLLKQEEILAGLLAILVRQREALKEGRMSDLQALMSDLRHISVRCQAIETKRAKAAEELAEALGCGPVVSEITAALPEEDALAVDEASKVLMGTVSKLKVEMEILPRLIEEARSLNEMMISEWRKLSQESVGMGLNGAFDARI